jgi:hypothetical protein
MLFFASSHSCVVLFLKKKLGDPWPQALWASFVGRGSVGSLNHPASASGERAVLKLYVHQAAGRQSVLLARCALL